MKRSALFTLFFFAALPAAVSALTAQSPAPSSEPDRTPSSSQGAKLTPAEVAEMRADVLAARKEYEAAAEAYVDLAKKDPKNAKLLNKIGVCYQSLGQNDLAERYYKKAVQADGKFGIALNNLGTLEYSYERYGKAIKYYKRALDHTTDSKASVYSNLGYAYSANKDFPRALDAFAKAVALDPEIYSRHASGGTLIEQRSSTDQADLFFLLAKTYAQAKDVDHTVQYLKLARDAGYKKLAAIKKDPAFAAVIADKRVLEVLQPQPLLAPAQSAPVSN